MNRRCMLIILLLCVLKISGQGTGLSDDDYDGNYDDLKSEETDAANLSSSLTTDSGMTVQNTDPMIDTTTVQPTTTSTAIPTTVSTTTSKPIETTTVLIEQKCPDNCRCFDNQVDCSHQHLLQIPKNLPYDTALLNLSHNNLVTLNVSDLINYSQLRQLILNDNRIETIINTEEFAKLPSLHHIDLTSNALKPLQGTEFIKARGLATLILTNNMDVVAPNVAIVQTHKLKTLNLANCSITNLDDNIFQNLSTLVALYLEDNPLDPDFNVNSFKYLVNLRTLHIPKVGEETASQLCDMLDTLDMVQLTSDGFDLSCFLLSAGSTFAASTFKIGQTTLSTADVDSNDLYKFVTKKPHSIAPTTQKLIEKKKDDKNDLEEASPRVPSSQKKSPISLNETTIEHTTNLTQPADGVEEAKVNVPIDIIYIILVGVIAVTLIALIIGLICRMDCCGIKTKCCRRTHNRAGTEDQVQPHEAIPLNKV